MVNQGVEKWLDRTRKSLLVSLRSDWRKVCATSATVVGGAPGPVPEERGTGRGRLPPDTVALEVTRPRDSERGKRLKQCISTYKLTETLLTLSVYRHQASIFGASPGLISLDAEILFG